MTCYHPMIRLESQKRWSISKTDGHHFRPSHIISQAHEHYHDYIRLKQDQDKTGKLIKGEYKIQLLPCRHCIGCRLEYSKEWANRGYLEMKNDPENTYFATLTYNDENLPIMEGHTTETSKGCLEPLHLKRFIHDLRQKMQRQYNITGIKYLACGEYGSEEERPHYHIILFHCPLDIKDFYNAKIINKEIYWQHKMIEECWKKGFSNVTPSSWNTIAYVARYITKKQYGDIAQEIYKEKGQIPEFLRMSKGFGLEEYNLHHDEIWENDKIMIKNKKGMVEQSPPKYFKRKLKEQDEWKYELLKDRRENKTKQLQQIKAESHSYDFLQQLEIEERTHEQKSKMLRRALENQKHKHD